MCIGGGLDGGAQPNVQGAAGLTELYSSLVVGLGHGRDLQQGLARCRLGRWRTCVNHGRHKLVQANRSLSITCAHPAILPS